MAYELLWEGKLLYRSYSGRVTRLEIEQSIADGHNDPRFDLLRYVINDYSGCDSLVISPIEIEEIAAITGAAESVNPRLRVAFITSDADIRKIVEAYLGEKLTKSPSCIVTSIPAAREWLSI